jgi:hypothetical protein
MESDTCYPGLWAIAPESCKCGGLVCLISSTRLDRAQVVIFDRALHAVPHSASPGALARFRSAARRLNLTDIAAANEAIRAVKNSPGSSSMHIRIEPEAMKEVESNFLLRENFLGCSCN